MTRRRRDRWPLASFFALPLALAAMPVAARSLAQIEARGVLLLCANPNAMPFAARHAERPGLQIEFARELAERLGLRLEVAWVAVAFHYSRVNCDIVMDAIMDEAALADRRLKPSIPYQDTGVALALPPGTVGVARFEDLGPDKRIAVQVGSVTQTLLGRRGLRTSPFIFEGEMLAALAAGEVEAAAVTPVSIGFWNQQHPDRRFEMARVYESEPELRWTLAVGMRRSDQALREAVDRAVAAMLADGSFARIYASYGIEHAPPRPRDSASSPSAPVR